MNSSQLKDTVTQIRQELLSGSFTVDATLNTLEYDIGSSTVDTQRVVLASNQPTVSIDQVMISGTATAVNAGVLGNGVQRVTLATNDAQSTQIITNTAVLSDAFAVAQRDDAAYAQTPITLSGRRELVGTTFQSLSLAFPFNEQFSRKDFAVDNNLLVASSDVNDTVAGTGARRFSISYIDSLGTQFTEIDLALNGRTGTALAAGCQTINWLEITEASFPDISNLGVISVAQAFTAGGVPTNSCYAQIPIDYNLLCSTVYRVPNNEVFYPTSLSFTASARSIIRVVTARTVTSNTRGLDMVAFELYADGEGHMSLEGMSPIAERCEIRVLARAYTGTADISFVLQGMRKTA